ncbi:MAG TPA: E2 ligase fold family C protein [Allosphingosinicella sp.]|nr:E2 ligase fold family C protein [Allosphingosinicella sp.]
MALPDFIERNVTAASGVLSGFSRDSFLSMLEASSIVIAIDDQAKRFEGRVAVDLVTNLLARLYPRITFLTLTKGVSPIVKELAELARSINPKIEIKYEPSGTLVSVVVGATPVSPKFNPIYVGSDNWLALLSTTSPARAGLTRNPFGAAAAACFAAANVFRRVFCLQLPRGLPDSEIVFSLYDFSREREGANPPLENLEFGEVYLAGVGAIGNAVVWSLARLKEAKGVIHLVDHENIELSNLQRYILTRFEDVRSAKVNLAAEHLRSAGFKVHRHRKRWGQVFATKKKNTCIPCVLTALDTAKDRIGVQASLPQSIINAWTQEDNLGVSRHSFLGEGACLACLYIPQGPVLNEDQIIASALRLSDRLMNVRTLLYTNAAVGRDLLSLLADRWKVPVEALYPYEQKPLRSFYQQAVCGGALLKLGADLSGQGVAVPMAHQSALAGVMLAAAWVVDSARQETPEASESTINLLRPLGEYIVRPSRKRSGERCICQDADFIEAYRQKYGLASPGGDETGPDAIV